MPQVYGHALVVHEEAVDLPAEKCQSVHFFPYAIPENSANVIMCGLLACYCLRIS